MKGSVNFMLKISFKLEPVTGKKRIIYVDDVFESNFDYDELTTDLCKGIIKEIDNSEVVSSNLIQSPTLDAIPPDLLSTGCKCVLLTTYLDEMFVSSMLGDNCLNALLKISDTKDIYLSVITTLLFNKEHFKGHKIYSIEENRLINDIYDYIELENKYQ